MIILVMFLILMIALNSCSTIPSGGLNIAYPDKPEPPVARFKDTGANCITNKELNSIGTFFIESQRYFRETEGIIDAVND